MDDKTVSFAEFRAKIKGAAFVRDEVRRCKHKSVAIDPSDGTLDCQECGKSLNPFTVLLNYVNSWAEIAKWREECKAAAQAQREKALLTWNTYRAWRPHLRAAQYIEKQWRSRMAPCCPHCGNGLLPEDFLEGRDRGSRGRSYELEMRTSKSAATVSSPAT